MIDNLFQSVADWINHNYLQFWFTVIFLGLIQLTKISIVRHYKEDIC